MLIIHVKSAYQFLSSYEFDQLLLPLLEEIISIDVTILRDQNSEFHGSESVTKCDTVFRLPSIKFKNKSLLLALTDCGLAPSSRFSCFANLSLPTQFISTRITSKKLTKCKCIPFSGWVLHFNQNCEHQTTPHRAMG